MRRIIAILLLTLTLFSLGINAFADGESAPTATGTITISNATYGKTYTLYKIFDATIDTSVNPTAVSYTYSGTKWNLEAAKYFTKDEYGYIQRISTDTSGYLSSEEIAALASLKDAVTDTRTASADTVEFGSLPYGYYYIESTLDTWPYENSRENPVVSINSAKPTATIIDKNQGPTWFDPEGAQGYEASEEQKMLGKHILLKDKDGKVIDRVKQNSVNFGDTVSFEVAFNATDYYGTDQVLTYFLNDTIADNFEIIQSTLEVYFNGTKVSDSEYTVSWTGKKAFTVAAPWYIPNADGTKSVKYSSNTIFKVTYDAILLPTAVIAGDGKLYTVNDGNINTATFDYRKESDSPKDGTKPDDPPPAGQPYHLSTPEFTVTYTYAVGLTKVDGESKRILKGAEFSILREGKKIKARETSTPGVYEYDAVSEDAVTVFKTDDQGVLVVKGLTDGIEYTLKETKSPNGYNRSLDGTKFTFYRDKRSEYVKNYSIEGVATDYKVNVLGMLFENERGIALPITGGMGTTLFYVVGGALVFVALLLLITKKRMHSEK